MGADERQPHQIKRKQFEKVIDALDAREHSEIAGLIVLHFFMKKA